MHDGTFEIRGANGAVLWSAFSALPAGPTDLGTTVADRDLDLTLPTAIANARSIRFTVGVVDKDSYGDNSYPGIAELEAFAP